jgi:hypothetical protein
VFERMLAIFGAQRMTAAWGDVPADERRAVWGAAIGAAVWSPVRGSYDLQSVGAALDELAAEPTTWPPSSGEFADRCQRFAQRPGRSVRALPVPRRTAEDIARGREHMDALRATLGRRRGAASRVPGEDDEPPPPPPACTCWTGLVRAETLCAACATFRRNRDAVRMATDGTAEDAQRSAA